MRILLINGPPRSGKDTAGTLAREVLPDSRTCKFANELKVRTHKLFGMNEEDPDIFEDCKDSPQKELMGLTPRRAYIAVSENLFKPLLGSGIFGTMLLREILKRDAEETRRGRPLGAIVIPDNGFAEEAKVLVAHFGSSECALLRVMRPGCGFENDSRSYITMPGIATETVHNNGTMEELRRAVRLALRRLGFDLSHLDTAGSLA